MGYRKHLSKKFRKPILDSIETELREMKLAGYDCCVTYDSQISNLVEIGYVDGPWAAVHVQMKKHGVVWRTSFSPDRRYPTALVRGVKNFSTFQEAWSYAKQWVKEHDSH